jgi:hypothetical protein
VAPAKLHLPQSARLELSNQTSDLVAAAPFPNLDITDTMNIPAMVALTVVIFAEKILPQGLLIARLTGICFFGAAIAALI